MRLFLLILSVCVSTFVFDSRATDQSQKQWKETERFVAERSLTDPRLTDGIEIYGADGVITIRTTHKIQVRVFTILGQLVSQGTISPGTSELRLNSRGIFIVKIGNLTQKVAL